MGISKIKPLTSQYHSVGGSRGRGLLCLALQLVTAYFPQWLRNSFYRAMHVVQSMVLASYVVSLSTCPSVCRSLTLMICGHISWVSSKVITRLISLGSSLFGASTSLISCKGNTPKFRCNRGGVAVFSRKPAISLKRGKIIPRMLLMTNRQFHSRFRLLPK